MPALTLAHDTNYTQVSQADMIAQQNLIRMYRGIEPMADGRAQGAWTVVVYGTRILNDVERAVRYRVLVTAASDDYDARFRAIRAAQAEFPGLTVHSAHADPETVNLIVQNQY